LKNPQANEVTRTYLYRENKNKESIEYESKTKVTLVIIIGVLAVACLHRAVLLPDMVVIRFMRTFRRHHAALVLALLIPLAFTAFLPFCTTETAQTSTCWSRCWGLAMFC
jgi:hypothetical protein